MNAHRRAAAGAVRVRRSSMSRSLTSSRLLRQVAARVDAARESAGAHRAQRRRQVAVGVQVVQARVELQLERVGVQLRVQVEAPAARRLELEAFDVDQPRAGVEAEVEADVLRAIFVEPDVEPAERARDLELGEGLGEIAASRWRRRPPTVSPSIFLPAATAPSASPASSSAPCRSMPGSDVAP